MTNKTLYAAVALILLLETAIILLLAPRVNVSATPPPFHGAECSCLDCHGPYNIHLRDRPRSKPTGQTTGSLP